MHDSTLAPTSHSAAFDIRCHASKQPKPSSTLDSSKKVAVCYGCGAKLQIQVPLGPGYVKPQKYEIKKLHRQLNKVRPARFTCHGNSIAIKH